MFDSLQFWELAMLGLSHFAMLALGLIVGALVVFIFD